MAVVRHQPSQSRTDSLPSVVASGTGRLLQACLDDDIEQICALVDATSRDDPAYPLHVGVHAASVALLDDAPPEGVYHKVRRLLEVPHPDSVLRLVLLYNAAELAVRVRQHNEARRLFRQARQMAVPSAPGPLRAALLLAEAGLRAALADYAGATELCHAAEREGIETRTHFGTKLRSQRVAFATWAHDFATAVDDLDALEAEAEFEKAMVAPLDTLRARLYCESGEPAKGLRLVDGLQDQNAGLSRSAYVQLCTELLIRNDRTDEADIVLEQAATDPGSLSAPIALGLRAMVSLFAGDIEAAREHGRQAIVGIDRGLPCDFEIPLRTLAEVELASSNTSKARRILHRLDPAASRMSLQMHWARLCLLDGDTDRAGEHFTRVHAQGHAYTAQAVRTAFELPAYRLVQLQSGLDPEPSATGNREGRRASPTGSTTSPLKLVGNSGCMRRVRRQIRSYAPMHAPVLVNGETGTGKEVVARLLHEQGPWAAEAFVPVNCGALSDTLIESELFGHARGAFTGAEQDRVGLFVAAGHGTIFLDEIHAMSARMQAALLRVLENREIRPVGSTEVVRTHARVLAATNESIEHLINAGRFRRDLYYRLARLQIVLDPLRTRSEDLAPLAAHWLRDVQGNYDVVVSDDLLAAMGEEPWPGNVRQFYNQIERMLLTAGDARVLTAEMLGPRSGLAVASDGSPGPLASPEGSNVPPPEAGRRNTRDRRRRLRQLVDQRQRITRADVVQLLRCSPNTATRDLQALAEEGYIRRVKTSAHLRTSYFVRSDRED